MLLTVAAFISFVQGVDSTPPVPTADEVAAKMMQHDTQQRLALCGYSGMRRYVLDNVNRHKHAEMVVSLIVEKDGSKRFNVVSSSGWGTARKHVFDKLLEAEAEASRPGSSEESRITPDNYEFRMLGAEEIAGRKAYVMGVRPKKEKKYLMVGTIWVDTEDYAIVRMQGAPAQNPSFWIKHVQFDRDYEKHGLFWLPTLNTSITDVRIFGPTKLSIQYFDYVLSEPSTAAARLSPMRPRLP